MSFFHLVGVVSVVWHHRPEAVLSSGQVDGPESVPEPGHRVVREVGRRRRLPLLPHQRLPLRLGLPRHRPLSLDQLLDVKRLVGGDPVNGGAAVGSERDPANLLRILQEVLKTVEAEVPVRNVSADQVSVFT